MREEKTKVEAPLSPISAITALVTGDSYGESFNVQWRNHKIRKPISQRKVKLLLTEDEICSFTHLQYYIELFLQRRMQNVKKLNQESVRRDSYWNGSTRLLKKLTRTVLLCQKRFNIWWRKKGCTNIFIMTKLRDSLSDLWFIWKTL